VSNYISCCLTPSEQGFSYISCCLTPSEQGFSYISCCLTPSQQGFSYISCCLTPSQQGFSYISCCLTPSQQGFSYISCILIKWWWCPLCARSTRFSSIFIFLAHWNKLKERLVAPLGHNFLILRPIFVFTP
jgi:hypothetical protein